MRRRDLLSLIGALNAVAIAGCGGSPGGPEDAGVDADGATDWDVAPPAEPALPALPAAPRLRSWACPEGWRSVVREGVTDETGGPFSWCAPPPPPRLRSGETVTPLEEGEGEGDRPVCDPAVDGTFPVLGLAGCQPLGDPCPAGAFPDVPAEVSGRRIYVLAGATGGDGRERSPFGTIGEAVEAAAAGDVVAIGRGTYEESVLVDRDLTLWGHCVRDTVIDAPPPWTVDGGAIEVAAGHGLSVRSLRITGGRAGVFSRGEVTLEGVWVHGASHAGVIAWSGRVVLDHVLVDSIRQTSSEVESGIGAYFVSEAGEVTAVVSSSTFEQNPGANILTGGASASSSLTAVLVRNPRHFEPYDFTGLGVGAVQGARTNASRIALDGLTLAMGVFGARVEVEDAVVTHCRVAEDFPYRADGLLVRDASTAVVRRGLFEDTEHTAIRSFSEVEAPATVELEDIVISEVRDGEGASSEIGYGLDLATSRATIRRALIADTEGTAVSLLSSDVATEDVWIADTTVDPVYGLGAGVVVAGCAATMTRTLIEGSRGGGFVAAGVASERLTLHLDDLSVLETGPGETGELGHGIELAGPVEVLGHRVLTRGSLCCGVSSYGEGAAVELEDVTVDETLPCGGDESPGSGIRFRSGAALSLARALVEDSSEAGLSFAGSGSRATISDLTVRLVLRGEADDVASGFGLALWDGAEATLSRVVIEDSDGAGIRLEGPGAVARGEDVRITGGRGPVTERRAFASGLVAVDGASLELSRALVVESVGFGAFASGPGTSLSLVDTIVRDTRAESDGGRTGLGLALLDGAAFSGQGLLLEGNRAFGVLSLDAASLDLRGALIRETLARAYDARFGRGLHIEGATAASLSSCRFEDNRDVAIAVFDGGAELSLSGVVVRHTLERSCLAMPPDAPDSCTTGRGYGLGAYDGASLLVHDLEISACPEVGLQLGGGATLEGADLRLLDNGLALNLTDMPSDFALDAAVEGLLLSGNGRDVDRSDRSIPERLDLL